MPYEWKNIQQKIMYCSKRLTLQGFAGKSCLFRKKYYNNCFSGYCENV